MQKMNESSYRLDRLLVMLAVGSRTQVRQMAKSGRIRINGQVARTVDLHVGPQDQITVDGAVLDTRTQRHIMLNKPRGVLTAARDPHQLTVLDLLPPQYASLGCMPVGRLDKDTEGLLLLTTDGALSHLLLSPKRHVWKCYLAEVDGPLDQADQKAFESGMELSDFTALPARMEIIHSAPDVSIAKAWVREGKYHQVRRMFAARRRTVTMLRRLSFGPLSLDDALSPGSFRELTDVELENLRQAVMGATTEDEE